MTEQLRWKPTSDFHAISECGNYHLSLAVIGEGKYYDAWFGSMAGNNLRHLHGSCDKAAAIQACQDDLDQQPRRAAAQE